MTPEATEIEGKPRFDYTLLDCVELINGCVVQFSDKFRKSMGRGDWREFHDLFGQLRVAEPNYLAAHPEVAQWADELTQNHFGVSVDDIETALKEVRYAYKEARKDPVDTKQKIQMVIQKFGCDFAPYEPSKRKPSTKSLKERLSKFNKYIFDRG
jgi:hypothetical protein